MPDNSMAYPSTHSPVHPFESASLFIRQFRAAYGSRIVIDGLTIPAIAPGTIVGILGANGAGKSTFLRGLARMLPATGQAQYHDINLLHCAQSTHLRTVGYLPQTLPQSSALLVYEAIQGALRATVPGISPQESDARITDIFAKLHMEALAMQPLKRLSGGQRQMVGLAQVLVRQTPLLLLDEPTSALDLRWQLLALQTVRHIVQTRQAIALMALHDLNLANRFCDQIILLRTGGLVASGTPEEALQSHHLLQAYRVHARMVFTEQTDRVVVIERIAAQ
ncbi:MAG: ABC transporter ATP-binding protein [Brachymonas sp.]|nr:ABC transporter ATP-binding protein [Brachymonas sp.]